ncbi:integral membrane protein TIGR01906 [Natronincola peptidivorans]|uniref:Integral membrane protein TIGR01906 n=1 Tax=Natronincola peptidivorans TaxID=426128 RepID=A0A1I0BF41_9FIRM|nr:TIGR01906 family membrane protein [Natronincola peptidivorans]SET05495.1 integral membrane protein TIGR01906 [Natronincola peptidivorans]
MKHKYFYSIFGILFTIVLLLSSVEYIAFNRNHYANSFEKYGITTATGMDANNLEYVMEDLLSYLKDQKDTLDTVAVVHAEEREVFGERERLHMIDVKDLFIKGRLLRNSGLAALTILFFGMIMKDPHWKINLAKTLFYAAIGNLMLLGAFLLLLYMDFNKYFTYFHLIFFDNDLWILDPQTEILIQMVPEGFFYDTSIRIIGLFIGCIITSGSLGYLFKKSKPESKHIMIKAYND